jgi:hypothetical protein
LDSTMSTATGSSENNTADTTAYGPKESLIDCQNCGEKVILFSRTIQTYCYHCGLAVTWLDDLGLYYEPVHPAAAPVSA